MREIIVSFVQKLQTHFNGKTVGGAGSDFGATLTNGPFDISTNFHQWENIVNPSIHVQIIQESAIGPNFECCGGRTQLTLNVRISVDYKGQSFSIASVLYEELRRWLCETVNYSLAPTGEDYLVIIDAGNITGTYLYEGDVFSIHTIVNMVYLRGYTT